MTLRQTIIKKLEEGLNEYEVRNYLLNNHIDTSTLHYTSLINYIREIDKLVFGDCFQCHKKFKKTILSQSQNHYFCNECFNNLSNLPKCYHCTFPILTNVNDSTFKEKLYCDTCFHILFKRCAGCNSILEPNPREINGYGRIQYRNQYWCAKCFAERFDTCDNCEEDFWREDLRTVGDEHFCRECFRSKNPIKDYTFTPSNLKFNKLKFEHTNFMGVELEVEPQSNIEENGIKFAQYLKSINNDQFIYFKEDSSIDGFELVTHPFTLQYSHKNIKWYEILKWLEKNKFTSFDNGSCGMHIHINKDNLTKFDQIKLRSIFSRCSYELNKLSNRRGKNTSYCEFEDYSYRKFRTHNLTSMDGRYWALNFNTKNQETIEIRIFRGTLIHKRFIANLQLVDGLVEFVKQYPLREALKGLEIWSDFKEFVVKSNRYKQLEWLFEKEGV